MASRNETPAVPYTIGSDQLPGLAKMLEECGELQHVIGKVMAAPEKLHPGSVLERCLVEEMGDVRAAIKYFASVHDYSDAVRDRANKKTKRHKASSRRTSAV